MGTSARFAGVDGTLHVDRPGPGVVLMTMVGVDTGEHGRAPFVALEDDVAAGPVEIFIDSRHGRAASPAVSGEWAMFFRDRRAHITQVHLLTAPRLPVESPELVRSYAMLADQLDLVTDAAEFERKLIARLGA